MKRFGLKSVITAASMAASLLWAGDALAQAKEAKDVRIVFVTHGQANDVYWSVVKNGMQAAAKAMGAQVEYHAPEVWDVVQMSQMIDAAVASKPDGLVVSIPDAAALKKSITSAKDAGIPVVVVDTGEEQIKEWGLDLWVGGGSEYDNGKKAGEMMGAQGVKAGICVNHEVGNVSLDKRCQGYTDGLAESGGKVEVVAATMDPTESAGRVEAYLSAHPDTTGLLTLGPTVASPILNRLRDLGTLSKMKVGTFDLSPDVLTAVDKGEMMFGIDNQQYMMGYLPVVFLTTKAMYGTFPTDAVRTGPAFVTKADAAKVLDLSKQGIR